VSFKNKIETEIFFFVSLYVCSHMCGLEKKLLLKQYIFLVFAEAGTDYVKFQFFPNFFDNIPISFRHVDIVTSLHLSLMK